MKDSWSTIKNQENYDNETVILTLTQFMKNILKRFRNIICGEQDLFFT